MLLMRYSEQRAKCLKCFVLCLKLNSFGVKRGRRQVMTLNFKKVIRSVFEGQLSNTSTVETSFSTDETGIKEKQEETKCKACFEDTFGEVSPLEGNLNSSRHCIDSTFNDEKVPEWDKVFKKILENNKAKYASLSQKNDGSPPKEQISTTKKHKNVLKIKRCPVKNTPACPVHKFHKNMEEEKVREIFAVSRSFKLDDPFQHNLNEYEGQGVNIFKPCDNRASEILSRKSQSLNSISKPYEPYIPVTGFIAVRPYLKDKMEHHCIPATNEVWDEDFLF